MKGPDGKVFQKAVKDSVKLLHRSGVPVAAFLGQSEPDMALKEKCLQEVQELDPSVQALYPDLADPEVLAALRVPPVHKLSDALRKLVDWQHDSIDGDGVIEAVPPTCLMTIFLLGRSGVGKSTLYNKFLGLGPMDRGYSQTAVGRPVTSGVQLSSGVLLLDRSGDSDLPFIRPSSEDFDGDQTVLLADCEGLECTGSSERIANAWFNLLECVRHALNPILWYCISDPRLLDNEIENLALISQKLPVVLVNVRGSANSVDAFKCWLAQEQGLPESVRSNFVSVNAIPHVTLADGSVGMMDSGMDDLVAISIANWQSATEMHERLLLCPKDRCYWWISIAVAGATAAGSSPIPIADFSVLFPIQVSMLLAIATELGFQITKALVASLVLEVLLGGGARFAGRILLAEGLKFVPGWGSVASGVLAGCFTASLGLAFYKTLFNLKETTQDYRNFKLNDNEVWARVMQNTKDAWSSNYDRGLTEMKKELQSQKSAPV
jgi:uncharacterized protein (DUF697 family)